MNLVKISQSYSMMRCWKGWMASKEISMDISVPHALLVHAPAELALREQVNGGMSCSAHGQLFHFQMAKRRGAADTGLHTVHCTVQYSTVLYADEAGIALAETLEDTVQ